MKQILYSSAVKKPHQTIDRFWSYVIGCTRAECWNWIGGLFSNGYGQFRWGKRKVKAHRFLWQLLNGPIPKGKIICHTCDNPKCVNPNHLFLGTHKDNAQDRDKKGRSGDGGSKTKKKTGQAMGIKNPAAKLNINNVRHLRILWRGGFWTISGLSRKFGISKSQVSNIIHKRSWSHVR